MSKTLIPLYYAIVKHFMDGQEDCAAGVVDALKPDYGDYKMLTLKDVEEALATAKENGMRLRPVWHGLCGAFWRALGEKTGRMRSRGICGWRKLRCRCFFSFAACAWRARLK